MQLVIKRSEWLHNEGGAVSKLLRPSDGKKCCLGFLALACGLTNQDIVDVASPVGIKREPLPAPLSALLKDQRTREGYPIPTGLCNDLMEVNDVYEYSDEMGAQEQNLTRLFKQIDVDVTFVD